MVLIIAILIINITLGGTAIVSINMQIPELSYINTTLPIKPLQSTILVLEKCNNTPIPFKYYNNTISIVNPTTCRNIEIEYVAYPNIKNSTFILDIDLSKIYKYAILRWSNNILLIPNLEDIKYIEFINTTCAILSPDHTYEIHYIVIPYINTRHKSSIEILNYIYIIIIVTIVIVLTVLYFKYLKHRFRIEFRKVEEKENLEYEDLSDIEKRIVELLISRGGSMLQSELYRLLDIPRTTLWRYVRRLEEKGIIKVEKVNRLNKIVLLKYCKKSHNYQS